MIYSFHPPPQKKKRKNENNKREVFINKVVHGVVVLVRQLVSF